MIACAVACVLLEQRYAERGATPPLLAMSLHDHWWLYNDPDVPAAIQWSDDNLLAVAARGTITILNPGALDGPRSFATVGAFKLDTLQVGALPRQPETSGTLLHAVATEARTQDVANSDASVLCMAWSPLGSTQQGGCILATVGSDHVVSMHGRLGRAGTGWDRQLCTLQVSVQSSLPPQASASSLPPCQGSVTCLGPVQQTQLTWQRREEGSGIFHCQCWSKLSAAPSLAQPRHLGHEV